MQLSAAVLVRRRAAAVVVAAAACALVAGIAGLGYLWVKSSSVFVLQSVAVRGGTESDRVAVRDAVARAAAGRSLLQISASDVASAIETVPTIRIASVDRDFPHTLRVHIVPERAVALAVAKGQYRSLVASSGRVLRVFDPHEVVPSLPRIWPSERPVPGGTLHNAPIQAALDALAARPSDFRAQVANVQLKPELGIVMRLNGGLDIILGPAARAPRQDARGSLGAAALPDEGGSGDPRIRRCVGAVPSRGHAARRLCGDGGPGQEAEEDRCE